MTDSSWSDDWEHPGVTKARADAEANVAAEAKAKIKQDAADAKAAKAQAKLDAAAAKAAKSGKSTTNSTTTTKPKPKRDGRQDNSPTSLSPYPERTTVSMYTIITAYYERNPVQYRDHIEARRAKLSVEGLELYREACRQQNVKSGGKFLPLGKVGLDDGDMLDVHFRLVGVAEALTDAPFEPISPEDFAAAMIQYETSK